MTTSMNNSDFDVSTATTSSTKAAAVVPPRRVSTLESGYAGDFQDQQEAARDVLQDDKILNQEESLNPKSHKNIFLMVGAATLLSACIFGASFGSASMSISNNGRRLLDSNNNQEQGDRSLGAVLANKNGNTASGSSAVVVGGKNNYVSGSNAIVGSGYDNTIFANTAIIGAGWDNQALSAAHNAMIGGGKHNNVYHENSVVVAGISNEARGYASFVGAGTNNDVREDGKYAAVVAGEGNEATAQSSFVGAGYKNNAFQKNAAVVAGHTNTANGENSFVGSGYFNVVDGARGFIGAGRNNKAMGEDSVVLGCYSEAQKKKSIAVGTNAIAGGENAAVFAFRDGDDCYNPTTNAVTMCTTNGFIVDDIHITNELTQAKDTLSSALSDSSPSSPLSNSVLYAENQALKAAVEAIGSRLAKLEARR
uniref:Trimeric autotransporter adhesin YadA-like head domain-containing protein n=1 Tax=Entomoneis paludosa TaxID=265537 RepID=A0A7S2YB09_9STRA|mmetsp:Transcript_2543/g.5206  ORF Transcript_2543/g.5206 Transcript_2543/m.5206 type:complete len:423 (+) Transcript_2543:126-1394(+)|eukprot:CAMPEP_0172462060 /NCGR_PEP_ID=MMETSP1065-20121228/42616_1 /TAXON_ID=265537 /ORGANISM="Amphiprora paludosa, Strain CCMP125" /LENGTH=422 /DNA_ID=CAMNT_0013217599 /DNA_START=116 /DNA_END=1384 /DNA_ORIENTATION=+